MESLRERDLQIRDWTKTKKKWISEIGIDCIGGMVIINSKNFYKSDWRVIDLVNYLSDSLFLERELPEIAANGVQLIMGSSFSDKIFISVLPKLFLYDQSNQSSLSCPHYSNSNWVEILCPFLDLVKKYKGFYHFYSKAVRLKIFILDEKLSFSPAERFKKDSFWKSNYPEMKKNYPFFEFNFLSESGRLQ